MQPIGLALWVAAIIASARADAPADRPPDAAADSICRDLVAQHNSLIALSLVYREAPADRPGRPPGGYSRRFVAASRPGFFFRDNGHGHAAMDWRDDPLRKTLLVTPAGSTLLENLNRVAIDLDPNRAGPPMSEIESELIFRAFCWWPFVGWQPPPVFGRPWSMAVLLGPGSYRLRPAPESVGDRPCHVLEVKEVDVLWVDRERPRCVLRREIYNPSTRSVASRFEMSGYREADDGIWLPSRLRNQQLDSYAHTPALRERAVTDAVFLIDEIKVNDAVGPATFRLDPGPGVLKRVAAPDGEPIETVEEGQAEHFRSILSWCRKVSPMPASGRPGMGSWAWPIGLLGQVIVVVAVVVVVARSGRLGLASPSPRPDQSGTRGTDGRVLEGSSAGDAHGVG